MFTSIVKQIEMKCFEMGALAAVLVDRGEANLFKNTWTSYPSPHILIPPNPLSPYTFSPTTLFSQMVFLSMLMSVCRVGAHLTQFVFVDKQVYDLNIWLAVYDMDISVSVLIFQAKN